ncbi:copia-like retrotransposable element [Ilyonectria robusta]
MRMIIRGIKLLRAGLDILRTGIESIDSFDAKSYEYRIEFLGIRFDVESATGLFDSHRIECGGSHSTFDDLESNVAHLIRHTNRTGHISFAIESNGANCSIENRSIRSNE